MTPEGEAEARTTRETLDGLATSRPLFSARQRFSADQRRWLIALTALSAILLLFAPIPFLIAINTLFLGYCGAIVLLRLWMLRQSWHPRVKDAPPPVDEARLPVVTILLPVYREAASLPGLARGLQRLDYPVDKLDIKIVLEADDEPTIAAARGCFQAEHHQIVIVPVSEPRTKPKACTWALSSARGEITVIYDAEDRPDPDQLRKAVAALDAGDATLACVQARLNWFNRQRNWLTGLFAMEYALLFDIVLPALSRIEAPIPLGGTSNFFRTCILRDVGGWDPYNVTEDADLGLRLAADGYRIGMIDSTTYEEAVSGIHAWMRQRSRWIKGYIQTWFVHTRAHGSKPAAFTRAWLARLVSVHLIVGGVIVSAIVNPLFWTLYLIWAFGLGGDWVARIYPSPLIEISFLTLLAGNFLVAYITMIAPLHRRWYNHCALIALMPIYWIMMSFAGYMALWQFITRPFYWEKTEHGTDDGDDDPVHVDARACKAGKT